MPRLILHTNSSFMTDATVTSAPNRVNVSVIQVVSTSSDPSPIGTRTLLDDDDDDDDMAASLVVVVVVVVVTDDEMERKNAFLAVLLLVVVER